MEHARGSYVFDTFDELRVGGWVCGHIHTIFYRIVNFDPNTPSQASGVEIISVGKGTPEWRRVQKKLRESLRRAKLVNLERVQNHTVCKHFAEALTAMQQAGEYVDLDDKESCMQELWHAADPDTLGKICRSEIGCVWVNHDQQFFIAFFLRVPSLRGIGRQ